MSTRAGRDKSKEDPMTLTMLRMSVFVAMIAAGVTSGATAQTTADPSRPNMTTAQATPGQGESAQPAQPGMSRPGMMGQGMMGRGMPDMMRPEMMGQGMMGGMMGGRGHMMKIMFAIADTNGDGALSFEEVTAIHKRIFDRVDANKDGKVTVEELQTFMRE
jgi:hypothetical protein